MPRRAATLADIARESGASRWTVSAILFPSERNRRVGFSDETKRKVLAAAKRLRYRPNRASRHLLANSTGVIGVLTEKFFTVPWGSISTMLAGARATGKVLSFESFSAADAELPLFVREHVVDGLIIYERIAERVEEAIRHHRIPVVWVNACRRGEADAINLDETGAIGRAVALAAARGKRRVGLITGPAGDAPHERERAAALASAAADAGMVGEVLALPHYTEPDAAAAVTRFLAAGPALVIAPVDGWAGLIYRLCRERGWAIPKHAAVICMQDPDRLLAYDPPVSAFAMPEMPLGELAVQALDRRITGGAPAPEIVVEYRFSDRGSV